MDFNSTLRMSPKWSSEYYVALESKDLQANAMALDYTGNYVLLAGRRYLAIRNLEDAEQIIQKFPRQSKYEVGAAEWNPSSHHRHMCSLSSNQRLEVLTLREDELKQTHCLRCHTRVITDLNWHKFEPFLLASCSVDTFIHIWDLRDSRRPTQSLSTIEEASQVRWNPLSPHLLASAHEGDIKIWDKRKASAPLQYIAAHVSKIHCLDWSPSRETQICSSSQDSSIKFFDTANTRKSAYSITTNAPVWRARHTPFGNGLLTAVVPPLRRGENSLLLWNTANRATSMHTFVGHRDVVLDFDWRKQKPGDEHFQLVTWSKDQTLLVWKVEPFIQKLCGYEPIESKDVEDVKASESPNVLRKTSPKIHPLQQEFSLLNVHIPNLVIKKMDAVARNVLVKATINSVTVNLKVSFPSAYPHGVPPGFEVVKEDSKVHDSIVAQLLQMLKHLAQQRVSKNRTCLEPCLRQMVTTLEQLSSDAENNRMYDRAYNIEPSSVFGGYNDAYIPFPRTSGAKFCSVGTLVCFGRPVHARKLSNKLEITPRALSTTPRALSALENIFAKRNDDYLTVSAYYYQRQRTRVKQSHSRVSKALVHIYDALGLFFVNRQLAEEYILDGDVSTICKHNAAAAALVGRWDLVQAWTLAESVAGPQQVDEEMPWTHHPFGNRLMQSMISHYASSHDIQMAAMLCCIFDKDQETSSRKSSLKSLLSPGHLPGKRRLKSGGSVYHTIPAAEVIADGWVIPLLRTTRSTSLDNLRIEEFVDKSVQKYPSNSLYEYYKTAYAETLHRWGLIYNRTEVLKYLRQPPEVHKGVEFVSDCEDCMIPSKFGSCSSCKKLTLKCMVCQVSVRGAANACVSCGHGGHTNCLKWWFSRKEVCLTGCGCQCLVETAGMFNP